MPHFPKPFFKKGRGVWYVEIDRKQINLGPDRDEAFRRYHQLHGPAASRRRYPAILSWGHRCLPGVVLRSTAPPTLTAGTEIGCRNSHGTIDPGSAVAQLRPFHVQQWIDAREGWADGSRRNAVRAVKRAFKWAEEQGYIDRSPVAHMKKPAGGKREVIVSQKEFDRFFASVAIRFPRSSRSSLGRPGAVRRSR